jgi:phospholipid/cholesterol/gamma-HCH transport system substrate-binding protein
LKLSKEFKIGIIVTAALALLYWGFNFLKGKDVFSNERIFVAIYNDVGGLERTNPVTINGLKVGQVREMYFASGSSANVVVEIVLKNDIPIPENSMAKIISSDLLGSKAIELRLGNSGVFAESGDTLLSDVEISIKDEVNRQLQPIKNKAENLMMSIDTVLTMLQGLFSKTNTENMTKSVQHLANSFKNIDHSTGMLDSIITNQRYRLDQILKNIEAITHNLEQNSENFNNIIANFSSISDTLARAKVSATLNNINTTMSEVAGITEKINKGEGTLGMLVNNDSLYIKIEKTSNELNLLLEDIRTNPKKYVRFSVF